MWKERKNQFDVRKIKQRNEHSRLCDWKNCKMLTSYNAGIFWKRGRTAGTQGILTDCWRMSKTAAGETEVPPAFLLQPQNEISRIKTKNPNPLPIGIKFGFLQCGGRGWIRTTEVVDGRFTVCSLWPLGNPSIMINFCDAEQWSWWWDSNPQPADYKSAALPTELHQHFAVFRRTLD